MNYCFCSLDVYDRDTGSNIYELYLEHIRDGMLPPAIRDLASTLIGNASVTIDYKQLPDSPLWGEIRRWVGYPLRLRQELSALPYRVHGGRELDLMTKNLKPLSVFTDLSPKGVAFLETYFEPAAKRCGWISVKYSESNDDKSQGRSMYALPSEAWRIPAYKTLRSVAKKTRWNDSLERLEGTLLGYTEEQNDQWLDYRMQHGLRWGSAAMYTSIAPKEIAHIEASGYKAFVRECTPDEKLTLYAPRHPSSMRPDTATVLKAVLPGRIARFYLPRKNLVKWPFETKSIGGMEFEVFVRPGAELADINRSIEGGIEILTSTNDTDQS